ncbi:unnamed protein product, partial [Vitis vinifera]
RGWRRGSEIGELERGLTTSFPEFPIWEGID